MYIRCSHHQSQCRKTITLHPFALCVCHSGSPGSLHVWSRHLRLDGISIHIEIGIRANRSCNRKARFWSTRGWPRAYRERARGNAAASWGRGVAGCGLTLLNPHPFAEAGDAQICLRTSFAPPIDRLVANDQLAISGGNLIAVKRNSLLWCCILRHVQRYYVE